MFVKEFFALDDERVEDIQEMKPHFGYDGYGELVFYRTYSRLKPNGQQENWNDVVIRVINGVMSIRKDWYLKNYIPWDENYWQEFAFQMAISMFNMYWMPPGRGLWAMGTEFVYERGSMPLYNCAALKLGEDLGEDIAWMMDALMLGVGVGFEPIRDSLKAQHPRGTFKYIIPDSREGWCNSVKLLIESYLNGSPKPIFIYDEIRPMGELIKGFGGVSSGPRPLKEFHSRIENFFLNYINNPQTYDIVRLKTDLANACGCCVVAGNVRRSAEIAMGWINDPTFLDLKDYDKHPEREAFGGMSNNTVKCFDDNHFDLLGDVARRVPIRGEPGVANLRNFRYGRIGKHQDNLKIDVADLLNPCGEITLESHELCNVVETCPTRCPDVETWYEACRYACFYSSTVSLLPTHSHTTNAVVTRNRRIGVGIIDFTGWKHTKGLNFVIKAMREGYNLIRLYNRDLANEAGVPESIKVTTIKPGGTVPKLVGCTPGAGYPTFKETLRATRIPKNHPITPLLINAGVPNEPEKYDPDNTLVFYYPILQGPAKPAANVSLWEQAINIITLQREWADNAVSNTLYFKPKWRLVKYIDNLDKVSYALSEFTTLDNQSIQLILENTDREVFSDDYRFVWDYFNGKQIGLRIYKFNPQHEEDDIEQVLSAVIPVVKSVSLLPHSPEGAYDQMPESGITEERFHQMKSKIKKVNWNMLTPDENYVPDGDADKYCSGGVCDINNLN